MPASEPVRWMERAPSTLHPPLRSSVRVAALRDAGRMNSPLHRHPCVLSWERIHPRSWVG